MSSNDDRISSHLTSMTESMTQAAKKIVTLSSSMQVSMDATIKRLERRIQEMDRETKTWRARFHSITKGTVFNTVLHGNPSKDDLYDLGKLATMKFQNEFPGNYVIEEYYNSNLGKYDLRIKFDSPADETAFLLRYD